MDKVANWDAADRRDLFTEASIRRGIAAAIVEKDFWVCWTLKRIFELTDGKHIVFKGGTSLSKVFGLIGRFSEDLDLSVQRDRLGFAGANSPDLMKSRTQRKEAVERLRLTCSAFIRDELAPALQASFASNLRTDTYWSLDADTIEPMTVHFTYPASLSPDTLLEYIRPAVKLEFGAGADPYPIGVHAIKPYASDEYPDQFQHASCNVVALEAERTFWEKATILHAEFYRPVDKPTPERLSRHYSDLAQLATSSIGTTALANPSLLERVTCTKSLYFPAAWASYGTARAGSLHLLPSVDRMHDLETDYERMREMYFEVPLTFEQILNALADTEKHING